MIGIDREVCLMKEVSKSYYLKNGRLDLSVLDETPISETEENVEVSNVEPRGIYMDEAIENIFQEMGNYFLDEEKNDKNT